MSNFLSSEFGHGETEEEVDDLFEGGDWEVDGQSEDYDEDMELWPENGLTGFQDEEEEEVSKAKGVYNELMLTNSREPTISGMLHHLRVL